MNSNLQTSILQADGRYFSDTELGVFERYLQTHQVRMEAYSTLCQKSDTFILLALKGLAQTDRAVVQEHGDKCKRDMSYVLRALALAILKDDDAGFREQLVLWMQNIMAALNKEEQSARAYKLLQEVIRNNMPAEHAKLVNAHLDEFITALTTGL